MTRTGSSMLTGRLGTHSAIRCFAAIFSERGWYRSDRRVGGVYRWIDDNMDPSWVSYELRVGQPRKLLSEIAAKSVSKKAVGFKHHLEHSSREITDFVLALQRPKIILTRNNFLAAYSSSKVVELTGQGSVRARRGPKVVHALATFDAQEFAAFCANRTALYANARAKAKGRRLEIDYVRARTDEGMAEIANFLGVDPAGFGAPKSAKRNSDDVLSRFENRSTVASYLRKKSLDQWAVES